MAGAERQSVVFGPDGSPVAAAELLAAGASLFAPTAATDGVGALLTNDRPTVELVLGALACGARLVSLPLPGRGADLGDHLALLRRACADHGVAEVVAADPIAGLLAARGLPVRPHSRLGDRPLAAPSGAGFRLVQFTSGSTQDPRPVVLDDAALGANVAAILDVVEPRSGDALVSWLPLAHDMGLVGMLLAGLAAGGPRWAGRGRLVLLEPQQFLRRPAVWLEALSRWRGSFTAAPDFGYRMAAQRATDAELDLSQLRCAIVGGEIVRADTLRGFAAAFAARGFDPMAFCPAYGMAELGVAATLTPPGRRWRDVSVSSAGLAEGRVRRPDDGAAGTALVSSGPALPGYEVAASGGPGRSGRIAVSGPSLGVDGRTARAFGDTAGRYRTGDEGFVVDGWLYVCGRTDDYLVAHGRNVYAPAVEAAVGALDGVRPGRVTAVGLPSGEWTVVAEPVGRDALDGPRAEGLRRRIRRAAVEATDARPDEVVLAAPGALPLTSSGKIQRNRVRAALATGHLALADPVGADPVGTGPVDAGAVTVE